MLLPSRNIFLNRSKRAACSNSLGESPVVRRKARRSVAGEVWSWAASAPRRKESSVTLTPARTAATCCTSAVAGSCSLGRQRRQGRKPWVSASCVVRKKRVLQRKGRRAGQDGRQ